MADSNRSETSEASQEAAVIGVVIAGVLASFTFPGPFDWASTLIGLLLLGVLIAYGRAPTEPKQWRRALGGAVGLAFCIVLILGRPLDTFEVGPESAEKYLLSGWTAERAGKKSGLDERDGDSQVTGTQEDRPTRDAADRPDQNAGLRLLVLWALLVTSIMIFWHWWVGRQSQAAQ